MARRFQKKIEVVHWTFAAGEFVGQAAGVAAFLAIGAQHLPETLLRIRGQWASNIAAVANPGIGVLVTCGLIHVPEGTGTTVLWSPSTDGDAPWVWWDVFNLLYRETVIDVIGSQNTLSSSRVIDSKAMRKVRNQELQLVMENTTLTGFSGASVDVAAAFRVLSGS